jgi:predicted nucleotidyltransferase
MILKPVFPTSLHQDSAELIRDYFLRIPNVDTVLVVNSCARGQAVPESDLDFAILVKPDTSAAEIENLMSVLQSYANTQSTLLKYKQSNQFAHLHLDIIDGSYTPAILEVGVAADFFEIEIGNHICYSAAMGTAGNYFRSLQNRWLPYYNEELRLRRLTMARIACEYDLDHIPFFIQRRLYFHAFDILCKAFQKYLQTLFIANRVYPMAYNKWIKEQVVEWLRRPDLYSRLLPILSISNIESNEINGKAEMLRELLNATMSA